VALSVGVPTVVTLTDLPEEIAVTGLTTMAVLGGDGSLTPVPTKVSGGSIVVLLSESAVLVPIATSAVFADLGNVVEHVRQEIAGAAALMVVEGFPGGEFRPSDQVTVQQAVTMFLRASGIPVQWETAMVTGVASSFINQGMTSGAPMPRIQAAQLIFDALGHFGFAFDLAQAEIGSLLAPFTDLTGLTAAEREAMAVCVKLGIFRGATETTMNPDSILNRSQMASLAVRLQDVILAQ